MFHPIKDKQLGQTAVEYILLLGVLAVVIISVFGYIRENYIGDPSQCDENPRGLLCAIARFSGLSSDARFQFFYFP